MKSNNENSLKKMILFLLFRIMTRSQMLKKIDVVSSTKKEIAAASLKSIPTKQYVEAAAIYSPWLIPDGIQRTTETNVSGFEMLC